MRLKNLWIDGFKNLNDFKIDFENRDGITVLIGNNASGKSNVLEAISAIFAGLYNPKLQPNFDYELEYCSDYSALIISKKNNKIICEMMPYVLINTETGTQVNEHGETLDELPEVVGFKEIPLNELLKTHMPSQIIALYSGEDLRLWNRYYKTFYTKFRKGIFLKNAPIKQNMFYIDGKYWNIALLTFLYSSLPNLQNFVSDIFQGRKVKSITLDLNIKNYQKYDDEVNINYLINFLRKLTREIGIINVHSGIFNLDIEKFSSADLGFEKEFFINLSTANALNKPATKLINKIIITLEDGSTVDNLSEGQKKQILLKLALEVLADEDSLLLFDEPDAHIHISNKKLIPEMLKDYGNREIILTTHSPTLAHSFDTKHLAYIENGKINEDYNSKEKLLNELTNGLMGVSEQQILLQSNKDILIVEGKTDEAYISAALKALKPDNEEYKDLEFNFLWLGGSDADNLDKIITQFTPKADQTIIAFLDNDSNGYKCITKALNIATEKKDFIGQRTKKGIYIHLYPKKDDFNWSVFEVEDYFPIDILKDFIFTNIQSFQSLKGKFSTKQKVAFSEECQKNDFDRSNFNGFKVLFDKILEIKNSNA